MTKSIKICCFLCCTIRASSLFSYTELHLYLVSTHSYRVASHILEETTKDIKNVYKGFLFLYKITFVLALKPKNKMQQMSRLFN